MLNKFGVIILLVNKFTSHLLINTLAQSGLFKKIYFKANKAPILVIYLRMKNMPIYVYKRFFKNKKSWFYQLFGLLYPYFYLYWIINVFKFDLFVGFGEPFA